jgi:hypothetical protein
MSRDALRHGDYLAVHHQHPMIASFDMTFDHDVPEPVRGTRPCRTDRVFVCQTRGDPPPLVTGQGLQNDRKANFVSDLHRTLEIPGHRAAGHRQTDAFEHALGKILVLRDVGCDDAGSVRCRGLDPAEITSEPQLNHRAGAEPPHRDSATACFLHDDTGGRTEACVPPEITETLNQRGGVYALPAQASTHQRRTGTDAGNAELLFLVLDDDPPETGASGLQGASKIDVAAGQSLKLQGNVFQHVRPSGALHQALDESTRVAARARMLAE